MDIVKQDRVYRLSGESAMLTCAYKGGFVDETDSRISRRFIQ